MCNTDEDPEKERMYLNILHDESVAGVIFSPTHKISASKDKFYSKVPFVIIDRTVKTDIADMVLLDNINAAHELASHLIANGYRKIAGLFGNASTTGKDRKSGFQNALEEYDLKPAAVHFVEPRIKHGYEKTKELLGQTERPDAIFTSNSLLTAGAFQAIRDCGLKVPDEVALVGFDETTWGALVDPPITLIAQPTEEIGRTATELLFQRIKEPKRAPKTVILKGKMLVRGSSASRQIEK